MASITTRAGKGSPLTNAEVDANFTNLNSFKVEQDASTGAANVPAGTNGERPGSPAAGMFRFNSDTSSFEGYDGSAWGSIGGGVEYTRKTANYTVAAGEGVIADTSGGSWTLTLPLSPSSGDYVLIADGDDWGSTNLTVGRNSSTIEGVSEDLTLDISGAHVTLVYDGTTWHVYTQIGAETGDSLVASDIGVTVQGYDADTAKLDVSQTWAANQNFADYLVQRPVLRDYAIEGSAIGNVGATRTFDLTVANFFSATLDQASTFTFSNPPGSGDFGGFVLELTDGGSDTITWPASVDWPGGSPPSLTASGVDQLVFTTRDGGTTWAGLVAGLDIK